MKVITCINEKGGVGKTTSATTLATALVSHGHKVLLIDADSQGHSTLAMQHKLRDGLANLLAANAAWKDVIVPVDPSLYNGDSVENALLLLVPSSTNTAVLGDKINSETLKHRLDELQGYLDYVVIDTSPKIDRLHSSFYIASDYLLYPTQCEYYSIAGLNRSLEHLEAARKIAAERGYRVGEMLGILPMMFNGKELVQYQNLGWLQGKYGQDAVLSPINLRTVWKQAAQEARPVFIYEPRSKAAKEAVRFVQEVEARLA